MKRHQVELPLGSGIDRGMTVITYGHYGRPVLVFPSEAGRAWDFENNGMVGAVADLINAGRVKLYCVDTFDAETWSDTGLPIEERALRHEAYEPWLTDNVVPFVHHDTAPACGADHDRLQPGRLPRRALRAPARRPVRRSRSACPATTTCPPGGRGATAATRPTSPTPPTTCPTSAVTTSTGCARGCRVLLVVGQGAWETHPTGSLPSTIKLADLLQEKGIRCELDLWGFDVSHDWEWWQRQLAHHLPRFC